MHFMDWAGRAVRERRFPRRNRRLRWIAEAEFGRAVERLRKGDIVIDCGANLGHVAHRLAETGATVFAFEPDTHAFTQLLKVLEGRKNVHLFESAVGTSDGFVTLYRAKGFDGDPDFYTQSSSLFADKINVDPTTGFKVAQADLIAFIAKLPKRVTLLKMDIEGAEVPILERLLDTGMIDLVDQAFIETHESRVPTLTARTAMLRARVKREKRANINLDWD